MESGVILSAKYAFPPNRLKYCGANSFQNALASFSKGTASASLLERELKKFRVQNAYLRLIARCSGLKPFDKKVTEAFWLGNPILEKVGENDLRTFILRNLFGPGLLSASRAKKIASRIRPGCSPHHSFHALFVGSATGKMRRTLGNASSCLVRWGEVESALDGKAVVRASGLERKNGKVIFGRPRSSLFNSPFEKLHRGDPVSLHWDCVVQKLSRRRLANLKKWTLRNLSAFNRAEAR